MELCTYLKLKEHLKKDKKISANELGSFYQDFGFPSLKPYSARKVLKKEQSGDSQHRNESSRKKIRSKEKRSRKTSNNTSQEDKCWTCGKTGHKSPDCPRKRKNKNKVNLHEIDEETKNKFLSILEE